LTNPSGLYIPNILWILVLALLIIYFYVYKKKVYNLSEKYRLWLGITAFLGIIFFLSFYPRIDLSNYEKISRGGISFLNSSGNFVYEKDNDRFRVRGNGVYDLYFEERRWKKKITFFMQDHEANEILIKNGRKKIYNSEDKKNPAFTFDLSKADNFKFKGRELIHIGLTVKTPSNKDFIYIRMSAE
ncbi:MAG: hypothetical protein ABFR75_12940, partial [Acidobacteriota bacterium]